MFWNMGFSSYVLLCLVLEVAGEIHHLFTSSYRSPALFALEYDNNTNALTQVAEFNAHAGHPWMSFSFDKKTLYAAERDGWSSYHVLSPSEIAFQSNLTLRGRCDGARLKHGTTNILAGQRAPYNIYGAGQSPCGNVISSKMDGSFERILENVTYNPDSRVYGMAHDPSGDYIYSADTSSNGLWTHKVDPVTGKLTAGRFTAHSEAEARPRRLAVHPSGNYLYVVLSKLNKVAVYSIERSSNGAQLAFTGKSFSLVPPGQENKRYRGSELAFSANNDILYLTSRYRVKRRDEEDEDGEGEDEKGEEGEKAENEKNQVKKRSIRSLGDMFGRAFKSPVKRQGQGSRPKDSNNGSPAAGAVLPGYLTGLQLSESPSGGNGAGYPLGIILQVSTSTSGGKSSAISAAPWSNEHITLADSEMGLVQVWRFEAVTDSPQPSAPFPESQPQHVEPSTGNAPNSSLNNGSNPNLIGNQNLAPNTTPPNPPQQGEQPPAFSITGRSLGKRHVLKNIRASIVSEWKAPAWAIGTGDPAAPRGENRQNYNKKGKAPGWGRGCCAHAVWYD